jgi:hypothetical protein
LGRILDAFFSDDFAQKHDYPLGLLAKQFGRFFKPTEQDDEENQALRDQKRDAAEKRYQRALKAASVSHGARVRQKQSSPEETAPEPVAEAPALLAADDKAVVAAFAAQLKGES